MAARTRKSAGGTNNGHYRYYGNTNTYGSTHSTGFQNTTDIVGNPQGDNPFFMERESRTGGITNGSRQRFGFLEEWVNYSVPASALSAPSFSVPVGTFRDINSVLAAQHPGEPPISLPVFLFELQDLPRMLKHAFGRAKLLNKAAGSDKLPDIRKYLRNPRNPAEDWLNYTFGWSPLLSDLMDIAGVAEIMSQKANRISNSKNRIIRRQFDLGKYSTVSAPVNVAFCTQGVGVNGDKITNFETRKWVSSRWKVSEEVFVAAKSDDYKYLFRAATGLDISLTHAWDAMPWSWLIDWCTGVGDIIHAKSNRFGIRFVSGCLMHHTKSTTVVVPRAVPSYMTCTSGQTIRETKVRTLVAPSLSNMGINIFSPRQLATLGALKVTRR